ncbi:MAG: NAD-dependent epimerase/dehydratase family protein [Caldilineaceae bacterium]|nr:NAD-dependent epimerase/dehydratase family protein [Caldilineaceae bacterium]MBP8109890.1 NAD-dependent epimerase/dehydratase family protein [Caldilineaceae bacterium]MBP8123476.1 NAD-dependent epimerase/dehydratase family protein [Caldilineaceae bacterium]MBP9074863.1 NAD-dependent epimerase/dehydratase family protein [Caldilineaceae bacterium]
MTVLVTGASGFLGGALARELVHRGEEVRILARSTSKLDHLADLSLTVIQGGLGDKAALAKAVAGATHVYHCAGLSADWGSWDDFFATNVTGTQNLLHAAHAAGSVQRFLHISTTDVYGYPKVACDESHPITDVGLPYNKSKGMGEQAVWDFGAETGLPFTVIRPVTIYGPRSKDFVVEIANLLADRSMIVVNGGQAVAGLLYIHNAVKGIIDAANSPNTLSKAYNLRDESTETWREYVDALADGLGLPRAKISLPQGMALGVGRLFETLYGGLRLSARPLLTRHAVYLIAVDQAYAIDRAKADFGFRSAVAFPQAMQKTIDWCNSPEGRAVIKRPKSK